MTTTVTKLQNLYINTAYDYLLILQGRKLITSRSRQGEYHSTYVVTSSDVRRQEMVNS